MLRQRGPRPSQGTAARGTGRGPWTAGLRGLVLALLAAAALLNVALAVVLLGHPEETRYGEALIYGHAARVLHGEPLYQRLDQAPFTAANYTPLYYWLAAALQALVGPGFLSGRLVSLLCGALSAAFVGWLAWRRTRAAWPTLAAALLFVGLGTVGPMPWTAAYKEDLLAVALALGSLVALDGARSRPRVVLAAILAGGAILTKQSFAGPAVAGTVWLVLCWRSAAPWFAATVALVVLGTAAALELTSGAFAANTIGANSHQPFDRLTFEHNLSELVTFQIVPTLLAAAALLGSASLRKSLLGLNWLGALLPVIPLGAIGADYNYWLQLAALSAAVSVAFVWTRRSSWAHGVGLVLLGANVAFGAVVVARQVQAHPEYILPAANDAAELAQLVQRVRETRGTVIADPLDVVVLADRPIVLEPILYSLFELDGSWDSRALVERICGGEVGLVVLGYPLAEIGQRFPVSVARVLERTLELEREVRIGGRPRFVLVPRRGAACT